MAPLAGIALRRAVIKNSSRLDALRRANLSQCTAPTSTLAHNAQHRPMLQPSSARPTAFSNFSRVEAIARSVDFASGGSTRFVWSR